MSVLFRLKFSEYLFTILVFFQFIKNYQEIFMKIRTYEDLIEALNIEKSGMATYATELGLTAADVTDNTQDLANLTTASDNVEIAAADKEATTEQRNALFNGDSKEKISPNAAFAISALPYPGALNGAYSRYKSRKARAEASANYTEQIGESMGYENPKSDAPAPSSVKPTLEANAAAIGYSVELVVGNRGESDQWEAQMRRKGEETWTTIKTATGKSADATITPTTPGQPEQIELRVILFKKNAVYGQPSDSVYVTVNP